MIRKSKHIVYIFITFMLLFTQGCVYDDGVCPDLPALSIPSNTIGYMSIRLQPADGYTRAAEFDFEYGKREELALAPGHHHFAVFYNEEQSTPLAVSQLADMVDYDNNNKTANSTVTFAAIAAKSEQRDLLEQLQECFVILNADLESTQLWTMTKEQLLNIIVDSPFCTGSDGKKYFTMCNSTFIENGQVVIASKVDTTKIFSSYLEAFEMAWKGEAAVDAPVERLTAKVSMRFAIDSYNQPGADRIFTPQNSQIILFTHLNEQGIPYYQGGFDSRIRITGWGMNGLEKESYLFRKVKADGNYFDGWYSTGYLRSFWSEDCHYTKEDYPWQYRKAFDASIPTYADSKTILRNFSFDELNASGFNKACEYTPENTYDFKDSSFNESLDSRAELLAGTHLIVCAELLTNLDRPDAFEAHDLYRDRNGNFYRSELDCVKALISALDNTLASHSFLKFKYYDWTKGGGGQMLFAKTHGEYHLYYNNTRLTTDNIDKIAASLTVDANIKGGDGKRFIWLDGMSIKDQAGKVMQIYENIDEVDSSKDIWLRDATTDDLKSFLLEYIGPVDHFRNGKMYYAVPIGFLRDEQNSSAGQDKYSIYGVVRNCVYDIMIQDVTGIGTSVDNVSQPVVPNKVSTNDHLFISIDILRWHDVEQNVPGVIS